MNDVLLNMNSQQVSLKVFPKKFREDSVNRVLLHQPLYRLSPFHLQYSTTGTSLVQQKQWVESEQLDWWRSPFLCVLFVYLVSQLFWRILFFFFGEGERERKKIIFNMYMCLLCVYMCLICVLFVYLVSQLFWRILFFFFGEGERERKKIIFNMYMCLLWSTPSSFSSFMCKKTFPHIMANSFCYFRAGLWPELMSKY